MRNLIVCVFLTISAAGTATAQSVVIHSLDHNGELSWSAPSGSVCNVEWASALHGSTDWHNSLVSEQGIIVSNGVGRTDIPMFYRVSCHTNGVLWPLPLGRVFVYAADTNDLTLKCVGKVWIANTEVVYSFLDHWKGNIVMRSTDHAVYLYEGDVEGIWMQVGEPGTTWTNAFGEVITLVSNETITVQAGTFDCLKYRRTNEPGHPYGAWTDRWLAPGVGLVKEDWPASSKADYELKAYYDN